MQGHMHHKRRLLMALVVSGGMAAGFGTAALPADASVRTFEVTLLGKIKKTVTVDVGLDTPLDQIKLPNLGPLPILSIRETTPATATPSSGLSLTITPSTSTQTPAAPVAPQAGEQLEVPAVTASEEEEPRARPARPRTPSAASTDGRRRSPSAPARTRPSCVTPTASRR